MNKPRTSRISTPTRILITLAGGVVVIMLGTMAIVSGFWTDNFQSVSQKILRFTQTTSAPSAPRDRELNEKPASQIARESLTPGPLPEGFGRMEVEDEGSSKQPQAEGEIKAPPFGAAPRSSPRPAAPGQVSSASRLVVQAGESLTRIANRNYPENRNLAILAVILANPAVAREDIIHPGQILYLPEINFAKQTIRLQDNLYYAIYGIYLSAENLREDAAWLAKKKIHFVVRDTRDHRGKAVYRVFLGGYATEEELAKALGDVKTKTR